MKNFMFIVNFNVFIVLLACASYILSWFLGIPVSMLIMPYGGALVIFLSLLLVFGLILISIWIKRGLVQPVRELRYAKFYKAGHCVVAIANFVLVGGIGLFLNAASISREDEYWAGVAMTTFIGPIGGVLAAAGLAMVIFIPLRRTPQD